MLVSWSVCRAKRGARPRSMGPTLCAASAYGDNDRVRAARVVILGGAAFSFWSLHTVEGVWDAVAHILSAFAVP